MHASVPSQCLTFLKNVCVLNDSTEKSCVVFRASFHQRVGSVNMKLCLLQWHKHKALRLSRNVRVCLQ